MALSCLFGARRSVEHRCDYVRNALLTINVYFCDDSGGGKKVTFLETLKGLKWRQ